MADLRTVVDKLLDLAANANSPVEALQYSQAALNAANTHHALKDLPEKN